MVPHADGRITVDGDELRQHVERNGYVRVCFGGRKLLVHRLVCEAFHGAPPFIGAQVNHKNGVKSDNRADNLEWVTASENQRHRIDVLGHKGDTGSMRGRFGSAHNRAKPVEALDCSGAVVARFGSIHEAGRAGYHPANVCAAARGRKATAGGLRWRYAK